MKCELCKRTLSETFLKKVVGTYVKVAGKKHLVCRACQKSMDMREIKAKL